MTDVERDDRSRTALEQHLREAARGGAEVERSPARDVDAERVERGVELARATTDPPAAAVDLEHRVVTDPLRDPLRHRPVHEDPAGHDGRLGRRSGPDEASGDQGEIHPLVAHAPGSSRRCSSR